MKYVEDFYAFRYASFLSVPDRIRNNDEYSGTFGPSGFSGIND